MKEKETKKISFAKFLGHAIITILAAALFLIILKFIAGQITNFLFWLNDLVRHPTF